MGSASPYQFRKGAVADSPILMPLADRGIHLHSVTRFCRRACPGLPLLVPTITDRGEQEGSGPLVAGDSGADYLAILISKAVKAHGLSLIPIIAVGHAKGAEIAAQLALKHGYLLTACILLLPTASINPVPPGTLDGMHVLLVRTASEERPGSVGQQVSKVFQKAGAAVICERVLPRRALGSRETAIVQLFVATLFG
jgi:predicted esterase